MKKTFVILLSLLLWGVLRTFAQDSIPARSYFLNMACVQPLARLNATHRSFPGHIFVGFIIRTRQGLDSVEQYCGNQPAAPLVKQLFKKRKSGQGCTTIEGYMSMDESIYIKYRKVHILEIAVTEEEFKAALKIRDKWEKRKLFKVNGMDCVSFVEDVAVNAIHLSPIHRTYFHNLIPLQYWKNQIRQNADRVTCSTVYKCKLRRKNVGKRI